MRGLLNIYKIHHFKIYRQHFIRCKMYLYNKNISTNKDFAQNLLAFQCLSSVRTFQ
ncbi:hypothetical protein GW17_00056152 [Ensete ventricosum]|nr:hypothetical protein GW17_00056152 [Ensete ventricosum]